VAAENPQSKAPTGAGPPPETVSQSEAMDGLRRQTLSGLVGEQVLFALGKPHDLLKVQVRPLWGGRYRVNVIVGNDAASAKILHSYFVKADADGNVLSAAPKVDQHY
jgi:hypothetical protein